MAHISSLAFQSNAEMRDMADQICRNWSDCKLFLIEAEPGAGKSTLLPLELLQMSSGKILHTQPRRVAAVGVASRLAQNLAQNVGQSVGYSVRLDSKKTNQTRLNVITEGILTRMLREDPTLEGIDTVLLDEFHERSLLGDLNFALLREVQNAFRPDLKILLLTATPDPSWEQKLPEMKRFFVAGRTFPVSTSYALQRSVDPIQDLCRYVASEAPMDGSTLCFLPGAREIERAREGLIAIFAPMAQRIQVLHGTLPIQAQQEVVGQNSPGRIVLATNVAQTSLTLADVTLVVDTGLEKALRQDARTGLSELETRRIDQGAAHQRAGRAGRVRAGHCHRLWTQGEQAVLRPSTPPELLSADLEPLVLEMAAWSYTSPEDLPWLDLPPRAHWEAAVQRLKACGLLNEEGQLSEIGQNALKLPFAPRLGLLVYLAQESGQKDLGLLVAALLAERDPWRGYPAPVDLMLRIDALLTGARGSQWDRGTLARILDQVRALGGRVERITDLTGVGLWLVQCFPERIAVARPGGLGKFHLALGRGMKMEPGDLLARSKALIAPVVELAGADGVCRMAVELDPTLLKSKGTWTLEWDWPAGQTFPACREVLRCGVLALEERPVSGVPRQVLIEGVRNQWSKIPCEEWGVGAQWLRERSRSLWVGDVSDAELALEMADWLAQRLSAKPKKSEWEELLEGNAFWVERQEWSVRQDLENRLPLRWKGPAEQWLDVDYSGQFPQVQGRLQDFFGVQVHPMVDGKPLRVVLLSPAQRPLQITLDLPAFWRGSYQEVRKEMRGRYPKHNWPEEPWNAQAGQRMKPKAD